MFRLFPALTLEPRAESLVCTGLLWQRRLIRRLPLAQLLMFFATATRGFTNGHHAATGGVADDAVGLGAHGGG